MNDEHDQKVEALRAEAAEILNNTEGPLSDEQRSRLDAIETEMTDAKVRARAIAQVMAGDVSHLESGDSIRDNAGGGLQHLRRTDPWEGGDLHRADGPDLRSRSLSAVERMAGDDDAREAAAGIVGRNGEAVARWALTASQPNYVTAFEKVLRDPVRGHLAWTPEEGAAYRDLAALEQRIGSTTDAAGGFSIPVHLDPAFILSTAGASHPFRQISRVVQLAEGGTWNGVTTAGVTASFDTEGSEVSDDSPTLARAGIPVFRQAAFVGASFELIDDAPGLGTEVARLFTDAVDVGESQAFVSGDGTTAPMGIVTAVYGESSRRSMHATNSVFTTTDLMSAQQSLGPRWQARASWIGSLTYHNRVRAFGTDDYYAQTVQLDKGVSGQILGRPAYEASDMSTSLSTATNSAWVYGDFTNYVIVDKIGGTRISFIPHLFGDSNRPRGQAGWHMYRRVGAEPTTTTSFVVSSNPGA